MYIFGTHVTGTDTVSWSVGQLVSVTCSQTVEFNSEALNLYDTWSAIVATQARQMFV